MPSELIETSSSNGNMPASITNTNANATSPSLAQGGVKSMLSRILVPASSIAAISAKQEVTTIEIRRSPDRDAWITVRDGDEWTVGSVALIDADTNDGGGSTLYVVDMGLLSNPKVQREVKLYALRVAQTSDGALFLWALRKGDDNWAASARAGAELGTKGWVRVVSNRVNARYDIFSPDAQLNVDLAWPDMTMDEILTIAMRDRFVDSMDHAVLKKLRGAF